MKKFITIFLTLFLVLVPVTPVTQAGALKDKLNEFFSQEENFDKLKQSVINVIDAAITTIVSVEAKIEANTKVDAQAKNNAIQALENLEKGLNNYKTAVSNAKDLDDLKSINQEILTYINENKDVIKQTIQETIQNIAQKALTTAEKLKTTLEALLKTLEITCKEEAETIATLKQDLETLKTIINELKTAIQSKNAAQLKEALSKLATVGPQIAEKINTIAKECL